jgi:hypothetical protein
MGGVGVMVANVLEGRFVDVRKAAGYAPLDCWGPVFDAVALGLAAGAVCWLWVDPTRSVVEPRAGGPGG